MGCGLGLGRQISMGSKRNVGIRLLGIIAVARVGADSLQVGEGYILEKLGQIEIIRGVLILHVTLDLKEMDEELEKMADPDGFQKGWREWIRPEHGGVCDRYLKKKSLRRGKRGLLDIGGEALHLLFGTATEGQVDQIRDTIQVVSKEVCGLHAETASLEKDMESLREALRSEHSHLTKFQVVQRVVALCRGYDTMIQGARANHLDLDLFDKAQLQKEMDLFGQQIGFPPSVPLGDPRFERSIQTSVGQDNQIVVSILFGSSKFQHLRILPFPMFAAVSKKYKFSIKIDRSEVVINLDRNEIGLPSRASITKCIKVPGKTLCLPMLMQNVNTIKSCIVEIAVRNRTTSCALQKHPSQEVQVVKVGSTLLLSGEPGTVVHSRCSGKNTFLALPSSGVAQFGSHCSIQAKEFRLPSLERREVSLTLEEPSGLEGLRIEQEHLTQRLEKLLQPHPTEFWVTRSPQETFSLWGTLISLLVAALVGGLWVGRRGWTYWRGRRSQATPARTLRESNEGRGQNEGSTPGNDQGPPEQETLAAGGQAQLPPPGLEGDGSSQEEAGTGGPREAQFHLELTP